MSGRLQGAAADRDAFGTGRPTFHEHLERPAFQRLPVTVRRRRRCAPPESGGTLQRHLRADLALHARRGSALLGVEREHPRRRPGRPRPRNRAAPELLLGLAGKAGDECRADGRPGRAAADSLRASAGNRPRRRHAAYAAGRRREACWSGTSTYGTACRAKASSSASSIPSGCRYSSRSQTADGSSAASSPRAARVHPSRAASSARCPGPRAPAPAPLREARRRRRQVSRQSATVS